MTTEIKDSPNYAAQVIRVPAARKLPNSDRLYGLDVFGYLAVVDDSWIEREGELAVFFPAESQLHHDYVAYNGLYRHNELNMDPTEKGYLEDSRRIKAMKLRGNVSNGLVMPLSSFHFLGAATTDINLTEGVSFDTIDGFQVSRKYRIKEVIPRDKVAAKLAKAFKRVDEKLFPVHIETDQYLRNEGQLSDDDILIVTQKLHGTSWRGTRTLVRNKLTWLERLAAKLGVRVEKNSYDLLAGSRMVIKDPKSETQKHHYGYDLWTRKLEEVGDRIPDNVIVYGEIVGFTDGGGAIQKGHTYNAAPHTNELYVYRVSVITNAGELYDLSWDQVRGFCARHGFLHTPELWRGRKADFDLEVFTEKDFYKEFTLQLNPDYEADAPVPLSPGGTGADEGIVIRVDREGQIPMLFKFKNPSHYVYETDQLDSGEVDIESEES